MAEEIKEIKVTTVVTPTAAAAPRRRRFPFLSTLAEEIKKLEYETEEEAKQILFKDVAAARDEKDGVMRLAKTRLIDHRLGVEDLRSDLAEVRESLSGDNSGDKRPLDTDDKEEGEKTATDTSDNSKS